MKGFYQYSLLRYVHSQFLGEEVNAGIVFYFPDEDKIIFRYPKSLDRIKHLYRDFPEKLIRSYLVSFASAAYRFSKRKDIFRVRKLENILPEFFIVPDGSALFFDNVSTGVKYAESENIAVDIFNRYFLNSIPENKAIVERHDETYIVQNFRTLIRTKDENIVHYLRGEQKIKTERAILKVDESWKNGSLNLVKAVSFDLKEESDILHKAAQLYGTLNILDNTLSKQNYKIDILFSAPQNPELSSVYINAIDVVDTSKVKKNIYTENDIDNYIKKVLQEIERKSLEEDDAATEMANSLPF